MVRQYRTREGEATTANAKTQLTTTGSETAPGPLLVPQGTRALHSLIASCMADLAAAGTATGLVRLEGPGLPAGPEVIALASLGHNVATGGQGYMPARQIPLGVPVTPGNEILVFGEMAGDDLGSVHFDVTLVFE